MVALILAAGAWASTLSPFYLEFGQITYSLQQSIVVISLLSAGMMVIIIVGEIDISLPATLAIGNVMFAQMSTLGVPVWLALSTVILVGAMAGAINGLLVVSFGLPSLAVTLGTMGAYRAIALLLGGQEGFAGFEGSYIWLGSGTFSSYHLPTSLLFMVVVFVAFGLLMHRSVFGRLVYVVGSNAETARFSGIQVKRVKVVAFALGGAMAGLGSLVYIGQYQSARADNASDLLLFIVTAVVLGGVDIFGGRGRVVGVFLSLILLGTLKNGMGLANFPGPVQTLVIGLLLVFSVLASHSAASIGALIGAFDVRHRRSTRSGGLDQTREQQ
ncbi:MAG: ABC transporter permease [Fimbriimonadaceae bacterium]|nr:ABC transporter permease [Alphaproteobacteria bacterium]